MPSHLQCRAGATGLIYPQVWPEGKKHPKFSGSADGMHVLDSFYVRARQAQPNSCACLQLVLERAHSSLLGGRVNCASMCKLPLQAWDVRYCLHQYY